MNDELKPESNDEFFSDPIFAFLIMAPFLLGCDWNATGEISGQDKKVEDIKMEDNQKKISEEDMKAAIEGFAKDFKPNSKKVFFCPHCSHRSVCKKIEEPENECKYFLDGSTAKRYSSIYNMFQPIFDWIKFHYPAEDVRFIVERNSAKMVIEHGPAVYSKEITDYCCCPANPPKPASEENKEQPNEHKD